VPVCAGALTGVRGWPSGVAERVACGGGGRRSRRVKVPQGGRGGGHGSLRWRLGGGGVRGRGGVVVVLVVVLRGSGRRGCGLHGRCRRPLVCGGDLPYDDIDFRRIFFRTLPEGGGAPTLLIQTLSSISRETTVDVMSSPPPSPQNKIIPFRDHISARSFGVILPPYKRPARSTQTSHTRHQQQPIHEKKEAYGFRVQIGANEECIVVGI